MTLSACRSPVRTSPPCQTHRSALTIINVTTGTYDPDDRPAAATSPNRRRRTAALTAVVTIAGLVVATAPAGVQAAVSAPAPSGSARPGAASIRLGQVTLRRCGHNPRL